MRGATCSGPVYSDGISEPRSWYLVALFCVTAFARCRDDPGLGQNPRALTSCALFVSEIRRPILPDRAAPGSVTHSGVLLAVGQQASCPLFPPWSNIPAANWC